MSTTLTYPIAFLLAFCSMSYELLLAQQVSELAGDAYIWESISIAAFIAGMGLGAFQTSRVVNGHPLLNLMGIEITLGICGLLSPLWIDFLQILYRTYFYSTGFSPATDFSQSIYIFGFAATPMIFLIGFLTGCELPALLSRGAKTIYVLAIYNMGVFVAAVLFANLGNRFAAYSTASVVAFINLLVAVVLCFSLSEAKGIFRKSSILLLALPFIIHAGGSDLEQIQLKTFYYNKANFTHPSVGKIQYEEITPIGPWLAKAKDYPNILRQRSKYQIIDTVNNKGFQLHINGRFQISEATATRYHAPFALTPLKIYKKSEASDLLILGGGDGLTAKQLLDHTQASLDLIEIDPVVLNLAHKEPWLVELNGNSISNPRVNLKVDDAFSTLRASKQTYDGIYIDITYPFDFDSSRFYSYEFMRLIYRNLNSDGFFAVGIPSDPTLDSKFLDVVISTLGTAGFQSIVLYKSEHDIFLAASPKTVSTTPPSFDFLDERVHVQMLKGAIKSDSIHSLLAPKFFGTGDPFY